MAMNTRSNAPAGEMTIREKMALDVARSLVPRCVSLADWGKLPLTSVEIADALLSALSPDTGKEAKP